MSEMISEDSEFIDSLEIAGTIATSLMKELGVSEGDPRYMALHRVAKLAAEKGIGFAVDNPPSIDLKGEQL